MPKKKAKAKWTENVRSIVDNSRTHSVVCDLTLPEGGNDSGPTALELALMALADCGATIFADTCKKSNIEVSKVEVEVEAEKTPGNPIVSDVTMKVVASAKARKDLLEAAWRRTEANCPVLSIFKEPIQVRVEFEVKTE